MQFFLQTCTPNLDHSKHYFIQLGFDLLEGADYTIAYDQQMQIRIDHDRMARTGITLVKENWELEVQALKERTKVLQNKGDFYFADPSGCWYRLISGVGGPTPSTESKCVFGDFAGISLETMNIEKSLMIANILGFKKTAGALEQGWVTCEDDSKNTISFMVPFACPHLFFNPSATFFNGKSNTQIIERIFATGISVTEKITAFNPNGIVDNLVLCEPGGYGFFVFSD